MKRLWPMLILPVILMVAGVTLAAPPTPEALRGIEVTDHAGRPLDMGLTLTDDDGPYVLTDRFKRGKPTLLTFNYFRCRGVCDLQLRMISRDLPAWGLKADDDFNLVSLSFDPADTPQTAEARKEVLLGELKSTDPGWHFGVGNADEVLQLAAEAGVSIERVDETDQWAHPAVAVVLTPEGVISQYLGGVRPEVRDVRFALMGASKGDLGTLADFVWMSCFSYDPDSGSYVPEAWKVMRLGGLMTVLFLATWLGFLWRARPTLKEVPC